MKFTVKQARGLAGYTQDQMAEALGIHRTTYIRKERNPGTFSMEEAEKLCEITKMSMEQISFKR